MDESCLCKHLIMEVKTMKRKIITMNMKHYFHLHLTDLPNMKHVERQENNLEIQVVTFR